MIPIHPDQFLGLPPRDTQQADAVIVPLPLEKTVSYGSGTWRAPRAILDASCQLEWFDEETQVDFEKSPVIHTLPVLAHEGTLREYLDFAQQRVASLKDKFVVALGGEHTVSYGVVAGLVDDLSQLTIVQIDAHADLADELDGDRWSHGTVMRRLWDQGCRLLQIGVRSLSRDEYELAVTDDRITTHFAHQVADHWKAIIETIHELRGPVYLTIDVDGLDPSVIPSTGTPQPNGLTWLQTMEIVRAVTRAPQCQLIGTDIVEYVASPHPPGTDIIAAKLVAKVLAFWDTGRRTLIGR